MNTKLSGSPAGKGKLQASQVTRLLYRVVSGDVRGSESEKERLWDAARGVVDFLEPKLPPRPVAALSRCIQRALTGPWTGETRDRTYLLQVVGSRFGPAGLMFLRVSDGKHWASMVCPPAHGQTVRASTVVCIAKIRFNRHIRDGRVVFMVRTYEDVSSQYHEPSCRIGGDAVVAAVPPPADTLRGDVGMLPPTGQPDPFQRVSPSVHQPPASPARPSPCGSNASTKRRRNRCSTPSPGGKRDPSRAPSDPKSRSAKIKATCDCAEIWSSDGDKRDADGRPIRKELLSTFDTSDGCILNHYPLPRVADVAPDYPFGLSCDVRDLNDQQCSSILYYYYMQQIFGIHGKRNRGIAPECVQNAIRAAYPQRLHGFVGHRGIPSDSDDADSDDAIASEASSSTGIESSTGELSSSDGSSEFADSDDEMF